VRGLQAARGAAALERSHGCPLRQKSCDFGDQLATWIPSWIHSVAVEFRRQQAQIGICLVSGTGRFGFRNTGHGRYGWSLRRVPPKGVPGQQTCRAHREAGGRDPLPQRDIPPNASTHDTSREQPPCPSPRRKDAGRPGSSMDPILLRAHTSVAALVRRPPHSRFAKVTRSVTIGCVEAAPSTSLQAPTPHGTRFSQSIPQPRDGIPACRGSLLPFRELPPRHR
jgi:hypothetical protein